MMTLKGFLMATVAPVWAPADEGAPGGAPADGGDQGDQSTGGAGAPSTALGGASGDAGADSGDGSEGGEGGDDDGGSDDNGSDDGAAEPFKMDAPEGYENFQEDFDVFSTEANQWLQDNPKATPAEALKWAANRQAEAVAAQTQQLSSDFEKQVKDWENMAKADKEIGGDAYDANVAVAVRAIDQYGSDELRLALDESGLGNHPAVIKFAYNAGKALADAPVHKNMDGNARKSLADALYGNKK